MEISFLTYFFLSYFTFNMVFLLVMFSVWFITYHFGNDKKLWLKHFEKSKYADKLWYKIISSILILMYLPDEIIIYIVNYFYKERVFDEKN